MSRLLSFEEVDFPVLESEALFIRKAGEEITQQVCVDIYRHYIRFQFMFCFCNIVFGANYFGFENLFQLYNFEDKGGRRVVLRPEITPSLARLIMKQG